MPDMLKDDWSNLSEVVAQFRHLGYNDTYILNTLIMIAKANNDNKELERELQLLF